MYGPDSMYTDEHGRCFCNKHRRAACHECGYDFTMLNEMAEEQTGLRKPKTEVEEQAEQVAQAQVALAKMRGDPRYTQAEMAPTVKWLQDSASKIKALLQSGATTQAEVDEAMQKYMAKEHANEASTRAVFQAWQKENPGKTAMEWGGEDTQRLYDAVASAPPSATSGAVDTRTCDWCGKSSGEAKLLACSACKKANYCGKECQKAAWKGHKAICKQNRKASGDAQEPKKSKPKLPLTWAQLEQYGPSVATGKTLEVRVMEDRSMGRQCFGCKDRLGGVATIAAYTNSRRIP